MERTDSEATDDVSRKKPLWHEWTSQHYQLKGAPRRKMTLKEEIELVRQRLRSSNRFVIDPKSKSVRRWDVITFFALVCTAIVTPVEVAFLESKIDALFVWNRVIDMIFLFDLVLQFFLAYHDVGRGNILIKNRHLIAKRYVSSWFLIDLVSSYPFDLMGFVHHFFQNRSLRLLRLLKLARVARIQRIQSRWEVYAIFSMSYAALGLYKLSAMLAIFAHWCACLWGLAANESIIGKSTYSWIQARELLLVDPRGESDPRKLFHKGSAAETYTAALYFAIYTLTGIGYGDVTPTSHRETIVCVFLMAISAIFWAFMIGSFCSVIGSMNAQESQYRQRMDDLNFMMRDRRFPSELRTRCRLFLINSKLFHRSAGYRHLESLFSISLRGDVAALLHEHWVLKVWYLRSSSKDFIIELSHSLSSIMFAPMEVIDIVYALFILQSGIVARTGRILAKGSVWGTEFIMAETHLIDTTCAASLSYVNVVCISREDFFAILEDPLFEAEREAVAAASRFYSVKMRLVKLANDERNRRKKQKLKLATATTPHLARSVPDSLKPAPALRRTSTKTANQIPRDLGFDYGAGGDRSARSERNVKDKDSPVTPKKTVIQDPPSLDLAGGGTQMLVDRATVAMLTRKIGELENVLSQTAFNVEAVMTQMSDSGILRNSTTRFSRNASGGRGKLLGSQKSGANLVTKSRGITLGENPRA